MSNLSEATVWQAPASQPQARLQLVDAPALLPAVVFHGVSKQFLPGGDAPRALQQVDLEISRGSIFGIIGRSGAGKSTLLRLVNRLEAPSSGTVRVNGIDVLGLDADQLVLLRRRIGMVFQHFNLLSAKTVWENVALPLKIAGVPKAQIRKKVDALLDLVGLSEKRDCPPGRLSGGQKQRVGIARALVHDPDILLCDEATSALDPETTQAILALLKDIRRRLGLTIILITHEMAVIREVCDNVAVLEGGRVVESGAVWQVFGDPQHAATRGLLRPLVHDLPAEWATRLQRLDDGPVPGAPQASVLLDLRFTGVAREADVGALFNALAVHSPKVRLIHGALEPIQGHLQGRLVLSAELPAQLPPERAYRALLEVARGAADQAEALGYV